MTEEELNRLADRFEDIFGAVNSRILEDIGQTLKKIGSMTPSQAKQLQQMYTYGYDMALIEKQLVRTSGASQKEIERLFREVAQEGQDWTKPFYEAKGITQIPLKENVLLQEMLKSAATTTAHTLHNISSTTAVGIGRGEQFQPLGSFYKKTIDQALTAVATGTTDYHKAIRQAVMDLGASGLRVQYESGYTRRLDSAVRQNVLDGMGYVAQETAKRAGEEFGADGVELSAHSPSAPDHLPYQGRQYSNKEYDALQKTLVRPIGEWNCRHFSYPILLGISRPANSKAELQEMERYSNEKITIDGQAHTRYECTQLQRKLETKLRYVREEKALYQAVGDKQLTRGATERIRLLSHKYVEVSEKAGLRVRAERARVISAKTMGKRIVSGGKDGIIETGAKKTFGWRDRHAELMYEEIRKRTTDCRQIAENTIFTEKAVEEIKEHMFLQEHSFLDGSTRRFDPDFDQVQAWDRLTKGKYTDIDIILLKHEYVELVQMRLHQLAYEDAHKIANEKHNWLKALLESEKEA